jgi:hypothetical protein
MARKQLWIMTVRETNITTLDGAATSTMMNAALITQ